MDNQKKPVMLKAAVIGAGPSGLAAIKCCKEEDIDVTCFEKADCYGGIWKYSNTDDNIPATKSLLTLFSKEMDAYSDFPPPEAFPNYLNSSKKLDYLKSYVENFNLLPHIKFQKNVLEVIQSEDFELSGQWILKYVDKLDNVSKEELFDCVFVCTGRREFPHVPNFPDRTIFRGEIIHSKNMKSIQAFADLNVLVVGFGNSAAEIAVNLSAITKQVYLSVRNGRWLVSKSLNKGLPGDTQCLRRYIWLLQKMFPNKINTYWENILTNKLDHEKYRIKSNIKLLQRMPVINDDLPDKILTARAIIKNEIERFTEDGVIFKHDRTVTNIDCVILATGFETKLPFLDERFWATYGKESNLYKYVFPAGVSHNTLAVIGQVHPLGPSTPIAESQCRWASLVFKKRITLPPQHQMMQDIRTQADELKKRFPLSSKLCPQVDYISYLDELATEYDSKPNISQLLTTDPKLFFACYFGPCLPYQYRIQGPHSWSKSRDAILDAQERILLPLKSNVLNSDKLKSSRKKP